MTRRRLGSLLCFFGGLVVVLSLHVSVWQSFGVVSGIVLIAAGVSLDPPPGPEK